MASSSSSELYSPREIALAVGVSEADVRAQMTGGGYLRHDAAVALGRRLVAQIRQTATREPAALFAIVSADGSSQSRRVIAQLAMSSTVHAVVAFAVLLTAFNLAPRAAVLKPEAAPVDPMRLVFLAAPGPGGGGGGGGWQQPAAASKAMREGSEPISSPLPKRRDPPPIVAHVDPKPALAPPLASEQLPAVVAPIVTAPADSRDRVGVVEESSPNANSHGPGSSGGAGTGTGTGIGAGDGSGIGPGSGGGTGGGPYRPGSGIAPPRLVREVRADYTEEARQRGISGDVVLEIVVRRDGSVGDLKILQGLGGGLNDRAVQAVRQWRFAPAQRLGVAVDVIVEVAVEFKLR